MSASPPQALLFDLGGVVVEIDFDRALAAWQPWSRHSPEELAHAFRHDDAFERHERGEMPDDAYFRHLAGCLAFEGDRAGIEAGWNDLFVGTIDETLDLIRAVRRRVPCHAFTNTNPAHHATWAARYPAVPDAFGHVFTSHRLGAREPEREAFRRVVDAIGVDADAILFFDDNAANVAGARAAGLEAVLVHSPADVRTALWRAGLVD